MRLSLTSSLYPSLPPSVYVQSCRPAACAFVRLPTPVGLDAQALGQEIGCSLLRSQIRAIVDTERMSKEMHLTPRGRKRLGTCCAGTEIAV